MKKSGLILVSMLLLLAACSENSDEIVPDQTNQENDSKIEAYISPAMEAILNKIENATGPISIEEICPIINVSSDSLYENEDEDIQTRGAILTEIIGFDGYTILSTDVKVTFTQSQIYNWQIIFGQHAITAGTTYYLTIGAAVKDLFYSEGGYSIIKAAALGKYIGVDPDDSSQIGYHIDTVAPGMLFRLTTYVYGIRTGTTTNYSYYTIPIDFLNFFYPGELRWKYYEIN